MSIQDLDPDEWRKAALCAQVDAEMFYPNAGDSSQAAKAVCRLCPVQKQCLEAALANHEIYGIWGGLTPQERHAYATSRRKLCHWGHDLSGDGTIIGSKGLPVCRICSEIHSNQIQRGHGVA